MGTVEHWHLEDMIEQDHGTFFMLEFRVSQEDQICKPAGQQEIQTSVPEAGHSDTPLWGSEADASSMMQRHISGQARSPFHRYMRQFAVRTTTVSIWVHDLESPIVQLFQSICELSLLQEARQQCEQYWTERGMPAESRVTVVEPAPVFIALPRPHVIVSHPTNSDTPILCQVVEEGRMNLLSILLPQRFPPTSVAFLFELASPQNECEDGAECYLYHERRRFDYHHDIVLQEGAFVRIYEWRYRDAGSATTSCGSGSDDSFDLTWTPEYHRMAEEGARADEGENTATPIGRAQLQPHLTDAPTEENTATSVNAPIRRDRWRRTRPGGAALYDHEEAGLFQQQVTIRPSWRIADIAEEVEQADEADEQNEREWREQMDRILRATELFNYDFLEAEALGFYRARGHWPLFRLFGAGIRLRNNILALDARDQLSQDGFIIGLRLQIAETVAEEAVMKISVVRPIPTVFEQIGNDDVCLVLTSRPQVDKVLVLVVGIGINQYVSPHMAGFQIPKQLTTDQLLRISKLYDLCYSADLRCLVQYEGRELPRLVRWAAFEGMKINVEVVARTCTFDTLRRMRSQSVSLLQSQLRLMRSWHASPTRGLPPPGNPVQDVSWENIDLEKMDDLIWNDGKFIVTDFPRTSFLLYAGLVHWLKPQTKQVIQIADCLPELPIDLPDFSRLAAQLKTPKSKVRISWASILCRMSSELQEQASRLVLDEPSALEYIEIYTDGSYRSDSEAFLAGWAFVVLGYQGDMIYVVDQDWGLVQTDPMEPDWTGPDQSNAKSAEIAAMLRAVEWMFSAPYQCPRAFCFDSQLAGYSSAGIFSIRPDDRQLRILRAMSCALETAVPHCAHSWRHVKGHSEVLGNELADAMAKEAFETQAPLRVFQRPDYTPFVSGRRYAIETLWLFYAKTEQGCRLVRDCRLYLPKINIGGTLEERLPSEMVSERPTDPVRKALHLRFATYNVQTLGPKTGSILVQYMREQTRAHGIDVFFLQETRSRKDMLYCSETHFRFSAAAANGVGGVEIWLARAHDCRRHLAFRKEDTHVLIATQQIMLLKTECRGGQMLLLTFHAPHSGKTEKEIQCFWSGLEDMIHPFYSQLPTLIVGVDANAHFGEEHEPLISTAGLESRTDAGGRCFLHFLERFGLFVPSTFEHIHEGSHDTWFSNANGQGSRCDYICLPMSWKNGALRSWVLDTIDEGKESVDHCPLALDAKVILTTDRPAVRRVSYDRKGLQKASMEELEATMSTIRIPAWDLPIDQHACRLGQQIVSRLCEAYPQTNNRPRRSYIGEQSWSLRSDRLQARRTTKRLKSLLSQATLRVMFAAIWHRTNDRATCHLVVQVFSTMSKVIKSQRTSAMLTRSLIRSLRNDRTRSLEDLARQEAKLTPKEFADALKALGVRNSKKPGFAQQLPMIQNSSGAIIDTTEELQRCWREYFSEQEDGIPVTAAELLRQSDDRWLTQTTKPTLDLLPTLYQIEQQFRKTSPGKAMFIDQVPGELLHRLPRRMAQIYFSLFCKQAAFVQEANIFKGGFLVPAYKKGNPKLIQNFRSLYISSTVGKSFHALYRGDLVEYFDAQRLDLQVGGVPGQGLTQPVQSLRLMQMQAIRAGRSYAILFVDVANAFYRLLRQHIVAVQGERRDVRTLFDRLELPPDSYAEFQTMLSQPPAIEASGAPEHLRQLFSEFYKSTWFQLKHDQHLIQTRRGSRPGDTFADLCFSFALIKIVQVAVDRIVERYPALRISWNGLDSPIPGGIQYHKLDALMPIWADDLALAFDADSAEELIDMSREVVSIIFHRLRAAGLRPNLQTGKSELLIDVRGAGALEIRREMLRQNYSLQITGGEAPETIQMVGSYKHLGTWIQAGGGVAKDVGVKFGIAHDTMTKYKSQIFANRAMALCRKRQFFDSLIMSALLYNTAVWVPRNKRQTMQIEAGFTKLYKRLALYHWGKQALTWSSHWTLYKMRLPSSTTVLTVARLRYLGQLVRTGQPILWALLQRDGEWHDRTNQDLAYLMEYCPEADLPLPIQQHWDVLHDLLVKSPGYWRRLMRTLVARSISVQTIDAEWKHWHQEIRTELIAAKCVSMPTASQTSNTHYCLQCTRVFSKRSFLAVHAFKVHGKANRARAFVTGRQCEACLKIYELHSDALNHVKRSEHCYAFYQQRGVTVLREPGVNSRHEKHSKHALRQPFQQAEGPRQRPIRIQVPEEGPRETLKEEWTRAWQMRSDAQDGLDRVRRATLCTWLYHEEILATYDEWLKGMSQNEEMTLDDLSWLGRFPLRASIDWFISGQLKETVPDEEFEAFFQRQAWLMTAIKMPGPSEVTYHPKVFAHLFSGARREGDFQQFVELLDGMAISVDVIFDLDKGNLLKYETFQLFARALRERVLHGCLAGPPCETWSRARDVGTGGPRVLRSRQRLQGHKFLNCREAAQVSLGNSLLGVTLRLFLIALISGATSLIEHPASPDDAPHLPSIWYLPVIHLFRRFENCELIRIQQGRYGGKAPKPTDLLVANGGPRVNDFFVSRRTTPLPQGGWIGKDQAGKWKTTTLKEYPPDLCRILASLMSESQPHAEFLEEQPKWFMEAVALLTAKYDANATMGPDYCAAAAFAHNSELNPCKVTGESPSA